MFGSEIDFAPLVEAALSLLLAALTALSYWVGSVIRTRFKFAADFDAGQILDAAIHRGIDYARKTIIGADGKMTIQTSNAIVAYAARYVIDKLPETIEHFGFTEEKVRELILARLDAIVDIPDIETASKPAASYPAPADLDVGD
jgi:hypothetical protein